ncbi:MAG: peptidoglycan-binding protein [Oscillatoriophycideae cyanobacterium NC_groundwater_1537_Pr4_S-0.65um_50_18]|nr:peptidoglycan-binding protein [Oscillatoriophycideae cyanobacterium NC_groundwater_1537_Pr4_S-0.65um_50_18]
MHLKSVRSVFLAVSLLGMALSPSAIAHSRVNTHPSAAAPVWVATAYTDQTLPTLRRGDSGEAVRKLQGILQSNGFLGAADVRLGNRGYGTVDGVFGSVTESAIKDLQQRYDLPVTGVVNPGTWEVLDAHENPYRSPLPWKY